MPQPAESRPTALTQPLALEAIAPSRNRNMLVFVLALAAVIQFISATWIVKDFRTPNASWDIGRNLAHTGEFKGGEWSRLKGAHTHADDPPLRMFNLPAEPLLLAVGYACLSPALMAYLHIPVTLLLIGSITWLALQLGGWRLGLCVGVLADLDPFMVVHGPVWDDMFLGTALTWLILAIFTTVLLHPRTHARRPGRGWGLAVLCGLAAAIAALTRTESQAVLVLLAIAAILGPRLRLLWRESLLVIACVAIAVGAWGFRNQQVCGRFFLGTSHDGITLWESNYPSARESIQYHGQVEWLDYQRMDDDYAKTSSLTEYQANQYFTHRAVDYMLHHMPAIFSLGLYKLGLDVTGVDPRFGWTTPRNAVSCFSNAVWLILGPIGLLGMLRRMHAGSDLRQLLILALLITASIVCGLLVIGPIGLRYRMTLSPWFWLGVGWMVSSLLRQRHPGERQDRLQAPEVAGISERTLHTESH